MEDELWREVEQWRAVHDPIVLPDESEVWEEYVPDWVYEEIVEARKALAEQADEPPERATWGEVMAWCMAASTDPAYVTDEDFVGMYSLSFREFYGEDVPDTYISEETEELADDLRRDIRNERDEWFLTTGADEIPHDLRKQLAQAGEEPA